MRKLWLLAIVLLVVLSSWGCTTYTNGDAQVDNQTEGAAQDIVTQAKAAKDAVAANQSDAANKALDTILLDANDVYLNSKQQIDVHGGPQNFTNLKSYSATEAANSRQQSTQDHSMTWYEKVLYGALGFFAGLGGLWAALSRIPGLAALLGGPIGDLIGTLLSSLGKLHGKAQAGTLTPTDVVTEVEGISDDPTVRAWEGRLLNKLHLGAHSTPSAAAVSASAPDTLAPAAPATPAAVSAPAAVAVATEATTSVPGK